MPDTRAKFTAWSENQPLTNINASTIPPEEGNSGIAFRLETGGRVVQGAGLNSTLRAATAPSGPPDVPKDED